MRLLSRNAAQIIAIFLEDPTARRYGYELMQSTSIKSGSLYPVLGRFEQLGWISGQMEASVDGRPPRRVYTLEMDRYDDAKNALNRYIDTQRSKGAEIAAWGIIR